MDKKQEIQLLGEEKIPKLLLKFSIPCVVGLLIGAFYNIVDQIFIGNSELGYLGNAATGVSFPIICIANAFAWCIGDGAASFLSICSGRNDSDRAHKCVGTGITVSTIISILLGAVCLIFAQPLMRLFGASDQTEQMAVEYFQIIAAAFPVYLLSNVMNSMIRADGSPAFAMIALSTGAVINVILDPVFIYVAKWGIAGAAWATAIGQIVSFVLCAVYFIRPKCFKLTARSFLPNWPVLKEVVSLGLSTFVTQISIVVMALVCNMTLAHYGALSPYGQDIPISVFSIQTKVYTVVGNIVTGIVLGGQPIFGYNYGAGKLDRVRQTYRIVLLISIAVGLIATTIFQFWPELVINLFGAGDELYMEFAKKTFRIYLSLVTITGLTKMTTVFFQSIGKSFQAVTASLVRDLLCFTLLAIFLSAGLEQSQPGTGINGILWAAPIADAVAAVVILILTVTFFRKLEKISEETMDQNIKQRWVCYLGIPEHYEYAPAAQLVRKYDHPDFDGELYIQANGPGTFQRVLLLLPKNITGPVPGVVVPFYFPEAMLGFEPDTGEQLPRYEGVEMMLHLVKKGYAVASADAYHLTYLKMNEDRGDFSRWMKASAALLRDHPNWTGMGKLVADTWLLTDLLAADPRVDEKRLGIAGHSLGGKMAFYNGCLDERIRVILASDFGMGWDQSNWNEPWYWGQRLQALKDESLDHSSLLGITSGKPFCLLAGQYDDHRSWEMMQKAPGYTQERLRIVNHATGHRPTWDALCQGYDFLDQWLK